MWSRAGCDEAGDGGRRELGCAGPPGPVSLGKDVDTKFMDASDGPSTWQIQ